MRLLLTSFQVPIFGMSNDYFWLFRLLTAASFASIQLYKRIIGERAVDVPFFHVLILQIPMTHHQVLCNEGRPASSLCVCWCLYGNPGNFLHHLFSNCIEEKLIDWILIRLQIKLRLLLKIYTYSCSDSNHFWIHFLWYRCPHAVTTFPSSLNVKFDAHITQPTEKIIFLPELFIIPKFCLWFVERRNCFCYATNALFSWTSWLIAHSVSHCVDCTFGLLRFRQTVFFALDFDMKHRIRWHTHTQTHCKIMQTSNLWRVDRCKLSLCILIERWCIQF